MPIYTYQCQSCSAIAEKRQSFSDAPLTTCEQCGGNVRRLIHPVGIVFKGSGWYVTDSRASTKNGASADAPKKDEAKSDARSDAKQEAPTKNRPSDAIDKGSTSPSSSDRPAQSAPSAPTPATAK